MSIPLVELARGQGVLADHKVVILAISETAAS